MFLDLQKELTHASNATVVVFCPLPEPFLAAVAGFVDRSGDFLRFFFDVEAPRVGIEDIELCAEERPTRALVRLKLCVWLVPPEAIEMPLGLNHRLNPICACILLL